MSRNNLKSKIKDLTAARAPYNTLRALTIQRAVSMLEEAERGTYTRLAWTARKIEKRWSVMIGLKSNREGALLDMDWDVRTVPEDRLPEGASVRDAERQAIALRSRYERIENLREAIRWLHLASLRGFAHLEKIGEGGMATSGLDIARLEPIYQWHMIRDGMHGAWMFDAQLRGSVTAAEAIEENTLIVREVEDPICEVAIIAYIYEMLGRKDWAGFCEVFGIPDIFFVLPDSVTSDDLATWQTMIEEAIGDGKGLLPSGSTIETAGGDVRGSSPFREFVRFQREDVVLAGTGGQLTMLAESGSGTLAGGAQADVFERIAKREAREISEVFQRAIDWPALREQFPGQPPLAWFEIGAEDKEDVGAYVKNVSALARAGYITEPDQVQEKTGMRVTYQRPASGGAPAVNRRRAAPRRASLLKPWTWLRREGGAVLNRDSDLDPESEQLLENARKAFAEATARDLEPIARRLGEILEEASDKDLADELRRFQDDELPDLAREVLASNAAADALSGAQSAMLLNAIAATAENQEEAQNDD